MDHFLYCCSLTTARAQASHFVSAFLRSLFASCVALTATMDGQRRLEVLSRQLTAASLGQEAGLVDGVLVAGVCPRALGAWLVHDNPDLRARIVEFLKVRCGAAPARLGAQAKDSGTCTQCFQSWPPHARNAAPRGSQIHDH